MPELYMHRLRRRSAAVRWLRKGGSESGLMAQAGWGSRKMADRSRSASEELAADEFARLNLSVGDQRRHAGPVLPISRLYEVGLASVLGGRRQHPHRPAWGRVQSSRSM